MMSLEEIAAPPHPAQDAVGFYLVDDCDGRFVVDRATGVITLAEDQPLEAGAVRAARLRVVEASGSAYEMGLKLRMTGRVPQILGGEENDVLAGVAPAPVAEQSGRAATAEPLNWLRYAASSTTLGKQPLVGEAAPFGALFEIPAVFPEVCRLEGELRLDAALPRPSRADAAWAL